MVNLNLALWTMTAALALRSPAADRGLESGTKTLNPRSVLTSVLARLLVMVGAAFAPALHDRANKQGRTIFSMKHDTKKVFAFG